MLPLSSYAIDELDIYCKGKMTQDKYGNGHTLDKRFIINKNNPNEIIETTLANDGHPFKYEIDGIKNDKRGDGVKISYGSSIYSSSKKGNTTNIKTLKLNSLDNYTVYGTYYLVSLIAPDNKAHGKQIVTQAIKFGLECKNLLK